MNKLTELQEQLKMVKKEIIENEEDKKALLGKQEQLLYQIRIQQSPQVNATNSWCRITNALIQKYKPMTEEDPDRALKELTRIEGALLAGGFLTEQELKEAL